MTPRAKILATISVLVVCVIGVFLWLSTRTPAPVEPALEAVRAERRAVIGTSQEGRSIEAYTFGNGSKTLLFVGGIHGGYEWNTVLLAYQFIDYLSQHASDIPDTLSVVVIPSANPDGVYKVVGKEGRFTQADVSPDASVQASGRFNARSVDLNRNFECAWKPEATWRSKTVSAGSAPFSEAETQVLQQFILTTQPVGVVFWHSQANTVYAGDCAGVFLPLSLSMMNEYASAAGYQRAETFDSYPVTGSADGWLTTINIPSITVELQTHESVEWDKNLAGSKALFSLFK